MHMPDREPAQIPQLGGWSQARQAKFLGLLAENGNVRAASARCGLSAQSAYKLRRRDPLFARAWAGALLLARDHAAQIIADRAIEGVEEPVFYRGEQVATRRRYDNRLLLAHMARLDRLADEQGHARDAARFDELLALVAGERLPELLDDGSDSHLPRPREAFADAAAAQAQRDCQAALAGKRRMAENARCAAIGEAGDAARSEAAIAWDGWHARACARVDALGRVPQPVERISDSPLLARPGLRAWTLSTVSTAGMAIGECGGPGPAHARPIASALTEKARNFKSASFPPAGKLRSRMRKV